MCSSPCTTGSTPAASGSTCRTTTIRNSPYSRVRARGRLWAAGCTSLLPWSKTTTISTIGPTNWNTTIPLIPTSIPKTWGHGVFPGLDLDGDGILDFAAAGADSSFLQYHVESPDLSFGDDFNNNGMPDLRENDNLADYMYPLDHRGFHAFLRYNPSSHAQLRLGAYRMGQPTLGLDSDAEYIEGQYQRDWQELGYVRANHRIKWVQDGIPNTVFNFGNQSSLQQDLLENRDALDNLTYVEWGLWTVPGMNIRTIATFKHVDLSDRAAADPLLASPGTITHFAMANKIDYTYNWQRFKIMPRL